MKINPKYFEDSDSNKTSVILSLKEFESYLDFADYIEDVRLYYKLKKGSQVFREAV